MAGIDAPWTGHAIDLSEAAAEDIGIKEAGEGEVEIQIIDSSKARKIR